MSIEREIEEYEFKKKLNNEIANFQLILSEKLPFATTNFLDKLSTLEIVFTHNIEGKYDAEYFSIQDNNRLIVNIPLKSIAMADEITPKFKEKLYLYQK